jgi:pyrroline-5-carboxylate reductase
MLGTIAFIGGGVMGEAILRSLLAQGLATPDRITVAEIVPSRREYLAATYKVQAVPEVRQAAAAASTIVLSVKPQNLSEVLADIGGSGILGPDRLLVSIIAGAGLHTLVHGAGHQSVIRAMPNTPAQVGAGITVWIASEGVSGAQKETARRLLAALGPEIEVAQEHYLDMATALSGSGPAYVFLVIEALIDAGVHVGMPRDMAEQLALQTVAGSAKFAMESGRHPAVLRNMVTSPGGTTTEGVLRLEEGGLRALFMRAVEAAYQKSRSLGREDSH